MTAKQPFRSHNVLRDHARPRSAPRPSDAALEAELLALIRPVLPDLLHRYRGLGLRSRLLTLPVMVAVLLTAVWRQVPGVRSLTALLAREHLFAQPFVDVSPTAVSKRLRMLPAALFADLFAALVPRFRQRARTRTRPLPPVLTRLLAHVDRVWAVDATTLEALFKRLDALRDVPGQVLGGTALAVADLGTHQPVHLTYDPDGAANEKRFLDILTPLVPPGTLLLFDLGFWSYAWFAQLTRARIRFVTRARADVSFRVLRTLADGGGLTDQIVRVGLYGVTTGPYALRLITVRRGGRTFRYLTNMLNPRQLAALDVPDLYARRWRIEDAFLVIKRLLGLSYLWGGAPNTVALQCWATWLAYATLVDLCDAVAEELHRPLERISLEMVYRGLYFYSTAVQAGDTRAPAAYLAAQRDLGIVKARRPKRERERQAARALDAPLDISRGVLS